MKLLLPIAILFSVSAHSSVEFYGLRQNQECKIANNKVTKSAKFLKGAAGYTTTNSINSFGMEELAEKAAKASTGRTLMEGFAFTVTIDGETSTLHYEDSKEAAALTQFITTACF